MDRDSTRSREARRRARGEPSHSSPGKTALTDRLPAATAEAGEFAPPAHRWETPTAFVDEATARGHGLVQFDASGPQACDDGAIHRLAEAGTSGGGGALPHAEAIQRAFGRHDVGGVIAHVGGAATTAAEAMQAHGFASGHHVAFAGAPDLHLAAHEAAHVIQQRGGVQLAGGVGHDDDAFEQHADAVADRVVRGESAEGLLDAHAGGGGGTAVQMRRPRRPRPEPAAPPTDMTISLEEADAARRETEEHDRFINQEMADGAAERRRDPLSLSYEGDNPLHRPAPRPPRRERPEEGPTFRAGETDGDIGEIEDEGRPRTYENGRRYGIRGEAEALGVDDRGEMDANVGSAGFEASAGPGGIVLEAEANIAEQNFDTGREPDAETIDHGARVGWSAGEGVGLRITRDDVDADGDEEFRLGLQAGPLQGEIMSEDPRNFVRDMANGQDYRERSEEPQAQAPAQQPAHAPRPPAQASVPEPQRQTGGPMWDRDSRASHLANRLGVPFERYRHFDEESGGFVTDDAAVEQGIRQYQRDHRLPETGEFDPATVRAMGQ